METREITITPAAARMLALPATPELLEGWVGPVEMSTTYDDFAGERRRFSPDRWFACVSHGMIPRPGVVWVSHPPVRATYYQGSPATEGAFNGGDGAQQGECHIYRLRLPLSRREVVHRVIDVAGLGVPCTQCAGDGRYIEHIDAPPCTRCCRTGHLRPPADLSAFRGPIAAEGWTSAELSAALVWLSWVRLAAGMKPIAALATRSVDGCYLVWPPYPGLRTPDPSFAMLVYGSDGPTLTALVPAAAP